MVVSFFELNSNDFLKNSTSLDLNLYFEKIKADVFPCELIISSSIEYETYSE